MPYFASHSWSPRIDAGVRDLVACREAGEDPRRIMARLKARIVACQGAGEDLPASFLHLSRMLAAACVAQTGMQTGMR
ncbi:MAG: hypothetical protein AB7O57_23570 [Hyphomicrobiaceae bacterium]